MNCANCGEETRSENVKSAFWQDGQLFVIEDIPAQVCDRCKEQYYDDQTVAQLELLRAGGLRPEHAVSELQVPVFSLKRYRKIAGLE